MLRLGLEPFVVLSGLFELAIKVIDPFHPLVQQDFQPLGIALFVCEFVTQLDDLGAQSVVLLL